MRGKRIDKAIFQVHIRRTKSSDRQIVCVIVIYAQSRYSSLSGLEARRAAVVAVGMEILQKTFTLNDKREIKVLFWI